MAHIPWNKQVELTRAQKQAISSSIATFQLGENSEGGSFRQAGIEYANQTGDYEYLLALDLFIKEENRHSQVLGKFMDSQAIPRIDKEWTDSTFRFIRKIAGLNVCISVLLTAEIIATVYYRALGRATSSPALRAVCDQILIDEAHHLVFQSGSLAKQRRKWSSIRRWFFVQLQRALMALTIVVVWREHRKVYLAGGYTMGQMAAETWATLENVLATIRSSITGPLPFPDDVQIPHPLYVMRFPVAPVGNSLCNVRAGKTHFRNRFRNV